MRPGCRACPRSAGTSRAVRVGDRNRRCAIPTRRFVRWRHHNPWRLAIDRRWPAPLAEWRSVADRDRPLAEQVVAGHRRSDRAEVEQVLDRLVALREDLLVHVAVGDLAKRDDRRLVVLPVAHRMGAVRELASPLRRDEHELEHVRYLLEAIFYGDSGHADCPPWAQGLSVYF